MSDDNSPVVEEQKKKRGRPAKADKNAVKEPKKRGRPAAEKNNAVRPAKSDNEDDAPPGPVKKGRGRPKGSHKKKVRGKIVRALQRIYKNWCYYQFLMVAPFSRGNC